MLYGKKNLPFSVQSPLSPAAHSPTLHFDHLHSWTNWCQLCEAFTLPRGVLALRWWVKDVWIHMFIHIRSDANDSNLDKSQLVDIFRSRCWNFKPPSLFLKEKDAKTVSFFGTKNNILKLPANSSFSRFIQYSTIHSSCNNCLLSN